MDESVSYPWDYRLKYLEVVSGNPWFNTASFSDLGFNSSTGYVLNSYDYTFEMAMSGKAVSNTSRVQFMGDISIGGVIIFNKGWRVAGINVWPPNGDSVAASMPVVTDAVTYLKLTFSGYDLYQNGLHASEQYTGSSFDSNDRMFTPLGWFELHTSHLACQTGGRFFGYRQTLNHPTLGFTTNYVPCIMAGVPCIYDTVNQRSYYQQGSGTVATGPQVPDNYDPYTEAMSV